jgi:hypothetical protein
VPEPPNPEWPQVLATVTACRYDAGAGRAMAFGLPSRHYRITYNYWAAGKLHTAEFTSDKAIPQNTLFPIRYNPEAPHRNSHTATTALPRSPILVIGVIGSILLSLAWFLLLRGCHGSPS